MMETVVPHRIALVGLMGAGKSRVGRLLARALEWPFVDADRLVEEEAGTTVAGIFRNEGEDGFRRRELRVLRDLADRRPPLVVATGGGIVEQEAAREILARSFRVLWLRITPEEAARRVGRSRSRPMLAGGDAVATLRGLADRRDPLYRSLAEVTLQTEARTHPEDLRDSILDLLEGGGSPD